MLRHDHWSAVFVLPALWTAWDHFWPHYPPGVLAGRLSSACADRIGDRPFGHHLPHDAGAGRHRRRLAHPPPARHGDGRAGHSARSLPVRCRLGDGRGSRARRLARRYASGSRRRTRRCASSAPSEPTRRCRSSTAYARRAGILAERGAEVIVLPEKFVGVTTGYADEARATLAQVARAHGVRIVAGLNHVDPPTPRNQAVVFGPNGQIEMEYDKQAAGPRLGGRVPARRPPRSAPHGQRPLGRGDLPRSHLPQARTRVRARRGQSDADSRLGLRRRPRADGRHHPSARRRGRLRDRPRRAGRRGPARRPPRTNRPRAAATPDAPEVLLVDGRTSDSRPHRLQPRRRLVRVAQRRRIRRAHRAHRQSTRGVGRDRSARLCATARTTASSSATSSAVSATSSALALAAACAARLGAGERDDAGLGEQPRQRHGRRLDVVRARRSLRSIAITGCAAATLLAENQAASARGPGGMDAGRVLAGEQALLERTVGEQRHVQLAAGVEHAVDLRRAVEQRVAHLVGRQRHAAPRQGCMRLRASPTRGSCSRRPRGPARPGRRRRRRPSRRRSAPRPDRPSGAGRDRRAAGRAA